MTVETIDDVLDIAAVKEQYVVRRPLDCIDSDTGGWVKATVVDFKIDELEEDLDVIVELPWGERHRFGYDLDGLWTNKFSDFCSMMGYKVNNFDDIVGDELWLLVRYIDKEDDEINSGTRLKYDKSPYGPWYLFHVIWWYFVRMVPILIAVIMIL